MLTEASNVNNCGDAARASHALSLSIRLGLAMQRLGDLQVNQYDIL